MAYGNKYRFRFQSDGGTAYEVRLLEDGYSGSVTDRPLGKSPVIRMQESDPFRPTSCDLVLECQTDGEYVDLYTTNPFQFKVEVYIWNPGQYTPYTVIWQGFVATELYSEPDIAPPYDVRITATDGLGILKEYDFEPSGSMSVREHLYWLLKKTGDERPAIFTASQLREYGGTAANFLDSVKIDLDYMEGKSCYDVLAELLTTMRCVLTFQGLRWVVIRETDAQISSIGMLSCLYSDYDLSEPTTTDSLPVGFSVGKMGVAELWPVGFLARRVIPAKKSVTVTSEWHPKNGAQPIEDWTGSGDYSSGSRYWMLGNLGGTGIMANSMDLFAFRHDIKVTVKVSAQEWGTLYGYPWMKVLAGWVEGGTTYYFNRESGWNTSGSAEDEEHRIDRTNWADDPGVAETIEVTIPAKNTGNSGYIAINVQGHRVKVYDVKVEVVMGGGYKDVISIDNGSRGAAPGLEISGGRELSTNLFPVNFVAGVFHKNSGYSASDIVTAFSDGSNTNKDFMSLTALAYAKEYAAPRIEITGTMNNDNGETYGHPPLFVKSHGVWAMVSSYDWDMKNEDIRFTAVTLPTATLEVASEEITSLPNN